MGWRVATFTITSGQTASNKIDLTENGSIRPCHLTIFAPAALTGTITVKVSNVVGGTMVNLQSGGSDVTFTQGEALPLGVLLAAEIQIVSGSAEAATRTFPVMGAAAYGVGR